ncbi:NUDIX hydrolase [Nesterenkonia pannonica]|uniref:NUDIX domain-containing protein n=1 Tax=Nesterenkonia pannonica TaxID=1548602 RepID=UPI0021648EC7|nr:NUDIX hydrolase [Nesterenkonia pannonica]
MEIKDSAADYPVTHRRSLASTPIFEVIEDRFDLGGEELTRGYVKHFSAVAVLALNEDDELLLLRQYRHPVRQLLWELPAGLLDVDAESMQAAAVRELAEEADIRAHTWQTLLDLHVTPGMSDESTRIYLAQGLEDVPEADRHARQGEEAEIVPRWVPLDEAVQPRPHR